jgi:hypothetical protein
VLRLRPAKQALIDAEADEPEGIVLHAAGAAEIASANRDAKSEGPFYAVLTTVGRNRLRIMRSVGGV